MGKVEFTQNDYIGQMDFIRHNVGDFAALYEVETAKGKKGYVRVYATADYLHYHDLEFVEQKHIVKKSFLDMTTVFKESESVLLIEFLWTATKTKYKVAIPYQKIVDWNNSDIKMN